METSQNMKKQIPLAKTLWGKLLFLSFHLTSFSLVLILSWNVDNWIEISKGKWVDVDHGSKIYFALACALPTIFLLGVIDLELFGEMPSRWKRKIFLSIFSFAIILFIASIMVMKNRSELNYPPIECDNRVKCNHLFLVSLLGFGTSICLLLAAISLGSDITKS